MAEEIRVQLFGGPHLFRGSVPVNLSLHQSALLGLIYGAEKGGMNRGEALTRFWPDLDEKRARRRLNQLLYAFKKKLGPSSVLLFRGSDILRSPTVGESDLHVFESALAVHSFHSCVALLSEGFLPGLKGTVTREMSAWAEDREAELRRVLRRHAERRLASCRREEDWEGAQVPAEALLALAPSDESRLRQAMEARARAGHLVEAQELMRDFADRNQTEGGHAWSAEGDTKKLLAEITALASARAAAPRREVQKVVEPPLLGRDEEKSALRKELRSLPRQALRGILITGEAGIGKTRLIQESLLGVSLDGHRILSAGAAELEQLIPLNPLIEAFKAPEVAARLQGLDEPWRTVLFGVMPTHYLGDGPIPAAPHIQPGSVPRRLFEAFYQLLRLLIQEGPVILVLEDLQWADETTLSVLEFLIRRWDHGGLQLVVSVRGEEVRRQKVLGSFLENLRVHEDVLEVPLKDLDEPSSAALIQALSPQGLPGPEVSHLLSLAGGNPFFLIELTLEFLAGRLAPLGLPQEILPIPLSIRQVLQRRLSQLSEDAEAALGALAVHSRPLGVKGIAQVARLSGSKCLAALDQLDRFRLVASRAGEKVVAHELVRQAVYQGLTETRRSWLHNRVARHLLRTRTRTPPDELAVHFDRAGAKEEARTYSIEAANRAEESGAIPEALRFLRIAREHTEEPAEVAELIWKMGHLNYLRQNLEEAAPLLELAAHRFRRQGEDARALRAEVERIDALAQRGLLPTRECIDELGRIKEEARAGGNWGIYMKALDVEVHRSDHAGDLEGVQRILKEAEDFANLGGPEARCQARAILALNFYYRSPHGAISAAREAVEIAMSTAEEDLQLHALNRLIVVLLYQGKLSTEEGKRAFQLAESRLVNSGDLILKFFVRLNKAVWYLEIGELDRAEAAFALVGPVIRGTKARDARANLLLNEGELFLAKHDTPTANRLFTDAEDCLQPSSPTSFRFIINAGLGLCALKVGHLDEARRREAALPPFPDCWSFDPSVVVTFKASMLRKRGDYRGAEALLLDVADDVRDRLITAWIKLVIEREGLRRRGFSLSPARMVEEALELAEQLGLEARIRQLQALL